MLCCGMVTAKKLIMSSFSKCFNNTSFKEMPPRGGPRKAVRILAVAADNPDDTLTFESYTAAAKHFQVTHHSRIRIALHTQQPVNGYNLTQLENSNSLTPPLVRVAPTSVPLVQEEICRLFGGDTVRSMRYTSDQPMRLSVYDIIRAVSTSANPRVVLLRLFSDMEFMYHKFTGSGERPTPVVEMHQIPFVVSRIIHSARLSTNDIQTWAKKLGYSTTELLQLRQGPIECDTIKILKQSFNMFECITQHRVLHYYVDMYLPEFNICIECDEYGHRAYNKQSEISRQDNITCSLQRVDNPVKWVRYNPHEPNFSIGNVVYDVLKHIQNQKFEDKIKKLSLELELQKQRTLQQELEVKKLKLMLQLQDQGGLPVVPPLSVS